MRLLSHLRSRSRSKHGKGSHEDSTDCYLGSASFPAVGNSYKAATLPPRVLKRLFAILCPHSEDETYTTAEESAYQSGCMLCSTRDLAHCLSVNTAWYSQAQNILYRSIRLDAVHYCDREGYLSEKRRHKSRFDRNGDPEDPTEKRLKLLARTLREAQSIASLVHILKVSFMAREAYKADLARIVSNLPNLRYVDLPEGFYRDDPASMTLKQELLYRCPNIRKMKFLAGSEVSFGGLAHYRQWQNLEILELKDLVVEAEILLHVLASFPALRTLSLGRISSLDNAILRPNPSLPPFPCVVSLSLQKAPSLGSAGLLAYLSRPDVGYTLSSLALSGTGILPQDLHVIVDAAPSLTSLTINEIVSRPFPLTPIPPIASASLQSLRYLVLPESTSALNDPSDTYYTYLASSLTSSSLPRMASLYVYCPSFPDLLLLPPMVPFGNGEGALLPSRLSMFGAPGAGGPSFAPGSRLSMIGMGAPADPRQVSASVSALGLKAPLKVYSKPAEALEMDWQITLIEPPTARNNRRGSLSITRPMSLFGLQSGVAPGDDGEYALDTPRKTGGFLGVEKHKHGKSGGTTEEWMG